MNKKKKLLLENSLNEAINTKPKTDIQANTKSLLQNYSEDSPLVLNMGVDSSEALSSQTRVTRQTTQARQTRQTKKSDEIAPMRDFQKVPNSIAKSAIPDGLFRPGKSKQLYDVLYSLTRGAYEPKRSIRVSKTKLRSLAGIGSRITFDSIISQFEISGLVKVTIFAGEHEGNEFEVFLPEEIASLPSVSSQTRLGSHVQKLDGLVSPESSQTSQSLNAANTDISEKPKTLFKTLTFIDDETPLISALVSLNKAAQAATGKNLTVKDLEAFEEIVAMIIDETTIAKSRTKSISVYLKFAAENLRRRLYPKSPPRKPFKSEKPKGMEVGKWDRQKEPLGDSRDIVLESLKSIAAKDGIEAVEFFREQYTDADWQWLIENLKRNDG